MYKEKPQPDGLSVQNADFRCGFCGAQRVIAIRVGDIVRNVEHARYIARFARCPRCSRADRRAWRRYWFIASLKVVFGVAALALGALATGVKLFWIAPPLGLVVAWVDHRRFRRVLTLVMMDATVMGGPPNERLPLP